MPHGCALQDEQWRERHATIEQSSKDDDAAELAAELREKKKAASSGKKGGKRSQGQVSAEAVGGDAPTTSESIS